MRSLGVRILIELIDTYEAKPTKISVWDFVIRAKVRPEVASSLNFPWLSVRLYRRLLVRLLVVMRYVNNIPGSLLTFKEGERNFWRCWG